MMKMQCSTTPCLEAGRRVRGRRRERGGIGSRQGSAEAAHRDDSSKERINATRRRERGRFFLRAARCCYEKVSGGGAAGQADGG